jgi:hypothetical protein
MYWTESWGGVKSNFFKLRVENVAVGDVLFVDFYVTRPPSGLFWTTGTRNDADLEVIITMVQVLQ